MEWMRNLLSDHSDESVFALLASFILVSLGLFLWRTLCRRIGRSHYNDQTFLGTLERAVRLPGYFLILALGVYFGVEMWPSFPSKASWLVSLKLIISFAGIIFMGEALFSIGIDFYLRHRKNMVVPTIFNQLAKAIIYIIVGLSFLSTTYKIDITPLLTTSAVFTMIIGLALQDVLGNLFSGISVHISPPFKIGDWIRIAGYTGKVAETSWRATTLKTVKNEAITLPNNDISKKEIINLSPLSGAIAEELPVGLSYGTSPAQGKIALEESCLQVEDILKNPHPMAILESFGDFSINYRVRYWISDYGKASGIRSKLASRVWYRLKREGITIPYPIREIYTHPEKDNTDQIIEKRLGILEQVDFLKPLSRLNKAFLATNLREEWFDAGEKIVKKGDAGSDFFIIEQGEVSVFIDDALQTAIAILGEKAFFGEMSLLTGEPRSATIKANHETRLLVLGKDTFSPLLHENAEMAQIISSALADRQERTQTIQIASSSASQPRVETQDASCKVPQTTSVILDRIKRFFLLK